jgi:hypothetical protein
MKGEEGKTVREWLEKRDVQQRQRKLKNLKINIYKRPQVRHRES